MKRLIAYSSIAHMNLLTMGFFSNALEGLEGAILQCLSHAFVSSGLFFLIGFLYDRYHTKLYTHFSGLTIGNPIFSIMMNFYTFANIAFPGTSAFISEFVMLNGIFYTSPTCCFIAGTSIFFSAVYGLWINNKILFGNIKTIHTSHYNDLTHREIFILMWMLVFIIKIGVYSNT
jgi:NADH-quinone oxidoreductase subunit M